MDEAALLADRVGIMDHGHLLALDTPDALISLLEGEGTLELTADQAADGDVVDALAALGGVQEVETVQVGVGRRCTRFAGSRFTACNPITYVSEAFRGAMVPGCRTSSPGSASSC